MHDVDAVHRDIPLAEARTQLKALIDPLERTRTVSLDAATGHVLATPVAAAADVPHYPKAAMDGFAVRATDTNPAPATLTRTTDTVDPGTTVSVHTGSELPDGADAIVRRERVTVAEDTVTVTDAVAVGADIAPVGEDVTAGQPLYEAGHRLRPADRGLLAATGHTTVTVTPPPTVAIHPTGDELVDTDPDPGEAIETNAGTLTDLTTDWGGGPRRHGVVPDDPDAIRAAVTDATDAHLIVTIGGSSVGTRDHVPDVVADVGDLLVHGLTIKPGHPVGLGRLAETPVLLVPGYPVSSIIAATQLLRPAINWLLGTDPPSVPTTEASLADPIDSDEGTRRFSRVHLESDGDTPTAVPTDHSGAGVLSSVALTDGWVVVPESTGRVVAGSTVTVQDWEYHP
ncbi:MAG: molybdopterin molybdotransferase MoeA [Halobacteriaceae archaeon]